MKAIWLVCCACGDYGLLQREVEGRDPGAQVLRVGDLDGLVAMTRAFSSRKGSAMIAADAFEAADVRKCVARLAAEGRCGRVTVLVNELEPAPIEELFRAGATEVVAARSALAGSGTDLPEGAAPRQMNDVFQTGAPSDAPDDLAERRAGERDGGCCRETWDDPHALRAEGDGLPRATGGPRTRVAVTEHERRPARLDRDIPCAAEASAPYDEMGYVHGVSLMDELDEVVGFEPRAEVARMPASAGVSPSSPDEDVSLRAHVPPAAGSASAPAGVTGDLSAVAMSPAASTGAAASPRPAGASAMQGPRAPLISAISGSGGCGKSTIVATMAHAASLLGLRAAVLDLDLMFGNLHDLMGVDVPVDMATLIEPSSAGALSEMAVVGASMRIAPGITLWGPVAAPERAELMARPVELLLELLRSEADVIFADTSVFWGDAVAAAVAQSDRCLVVGDAAVSSAASASRAIDLAARLGVPRTRMTSVFNRFGARGADEDVAMRYEIACALGSKMRIADGGSDLAALMAFGRADEAIGQTSTFAASVREATRQMLVELGCAVGPWSDTVADGRTHAERPRIRLPWKREASVR